VFTRRAAQLPNIRVHDLRHFAATTMLSSQVPLAMASKTLRHSTVSTTTEIYAHLLKPVAKRRGRLAKAIHALQNYEVATG
jgi:integrase